MDGRDIILRHIELESQRVGKDMNEGEWIQQLEKIKEDVEIRLEGARRRLKEHQEEMVRYLYRR